MIKWRFNRSRSPSKIKIKVRFLKKGNFCVQLEKFRTTLVKMPLPVGSYTGPSCWDKIKTGFAIGFCVGMVSGTLLGGYSAFRYGFRGKELISSVGKVMLQGGGSFGTFMAIGSGIRC